jgi:hypothetical protein
MDSYSRDVRLTHKAEIWPVEAGTAAFPVASVEQRNTNWVRLKDRVENGKEVPVVTAGGLLNGPHNYSWYALNATKKVRVFQHFLNFSTEYAYYIRILKCKFECSYSPHLSCP